jgi:hypothetical protein
LRREAVEFGALFIAAGIAHVFSTALGHRESGSVILIGLGAALCALVAAHLWWAHRRSRPRDVIASPPARLWRDAPRYATHRVSSLRWPPRSRPPVGTSCR